MVIKWDAPCSTDVCLDLSVSFTITGSIHYGFQITAWNEFSAHNLEVALIESLLVPIILLLTQSLRFIDMIPMSYSWRVSLKVCWFWWLFGLNWLVLSGLFIDADWLSWGMLLWTLVWIGQILISSLASARQH